MTIIALFKKINTAFKMHNFNVIQYNNILKLERISIKVLRIKV